MAVDKLQTLVKIMETLDNQVSKEDFVQSFEIVVNLVKSLQAANTDEFRRFNDEVLAIKRRLEADNSQNLDNLRQEAQLVATRLTGAIERVLERVEKKMAGVRDGIDGQDGKDGKDADEVRIVQEVLRRLPPPEALPGKEIVARINSLPTNRDEYKIDAKHIKNLPRDSQGNIIYGNVGLKGITAGDNIEVDGTNANFPTVNFTGYTGLTHITVGPTAPTNPNVYDLWVDVS